MIFSRKLVTDSKSRCVSFLTDLRFVLNEYIEFIRESKLNVRVASPLSILSSREERKEEVIKVFEPNTHIYTRKFLFPENRDIYLEYISNVPEGYGVLDPTDGCGYCIEDFDNYQGTVILTFYNDVMVVVKGFYDRNTDTYVFNNPGEVSLGYNSTYSVFYK